MIQTSIYIAICLALIWRIPSMITFHHLQMVKCSRCHANKSLVRNTLWIIWAVCWNLNQPRNSPSWSWSIMVVYGSVVITKAFVISSKLGDKQWNYQSLDWKSPCLHATNPSQTDIICSNDDTEGMVYGG